MFSKSSILSTLTLSMCIYHAAAVCNPGEVAIQKTKVALGGTLVFSTVITSDCDAFGQNGDANSAQAFNAADGICGSYTNGIMVNCANAADKNDPQVTSIVFPQSTDGDDSANLNFSNCRTTSESCPDGEDSIQVVVCCAP